MAILNAPYPYHGGKSRIVPDIWERFGEVGVFSDPFCGSCAGLLGSPYISRREIVNDQNGHIVNFWRALTHDPAGVAFYADHPSFHHDLAARHAWLIDWAREASDYLISDPGYFDVQAAGWWVWGISLWIGGGWCVDVGGPTSDRQPATPARGPQGVAAQRRIPSERMPAVLPTGGGRGVAAQRDKLPKIASRPGADGVAAQRLNVPQATPVFDRIPKMASRTPGGQGVSAQRLALPFDQVPYANHTGGGQGVSAQRSDVPERMPHVDPTGGGQGVSAQRRTLPDKRPRIYSSGGGEGVSAQRSNVPDKQPHIDSGGGGNGVAAQRRDLHAPARDQVPKITAVGGGLGVSTQRPNVPSDRRPIMLPRGGGHGVAAQRLNIPDDRIPHVSDRPGARGVSAQRRELVLPHQAGLGVAVERGFDDVGSGARLLDWFYKLAARFERVITLNRDWTAAVTPTALQHTPSSPKPEVAVFLDPPYRTTTGRADTLYHADFEGSSEDTAVAAYQWAVEHGEVYRIAYCCQVGDFEVPAGWDSVVYGQPQGREGAADLVMFSPRCKPKAKQGALL